MLKINRGWLVVAAAALAVGTSSVVRAGDGGDGGDSGDNGMNPMYGDSYAVLEGQGHNAGAPRIAPEGAYAAHEMDGQTTPLMDQMHQTQAAIAERTHAAAERMRSALNPTPSAAASTTSSATAISATPGTGTTSSSTIDTSQSTTDSGYRIAPVNPKGQAPTVVGPGG
ncbi:MAG TPA: hypothetical protein VEO36_12635 [Casimicrobiaceae bacterium]|nr:hypothetical protein [Casimicrobiaceae bacterium]